MFNVVVNTQAAITTARQENRHRRGDQEEVKGPQPVGLPDNQLQGVQRDDEDVLFLYSSSESQAPINQAPRSQSRNRRQPAAPVLGSIGAPTVIPPEVQAVLVLP